MRVRVAATPSEKSDRAKYHAALDEILDEIGGKKWGSVSVQMIYERGKIVMIARERETRKEFDMGAQQ